MGPRASLESAENLALTGIRFPDRPVLSVVATPTTLPRPTNYKYTIEKRTRDPPACSAVPQPTTDEHHAKRCIESLKADGW